MGMRLLRSIHMGTMRGFRSNEQNIKKYTKRIFTELDRIQLVKQLEYNCMCHDREKLSEKYLIQLRSNFLSNRIRIPFKYVQLSLN